MPTAKSSPRPPFVPDERQREAIEHVRGPLLVIAGAGTGKTSVLTQRIARLVEEGHAQPDEILALTYTNNAATEMRDRLRKLLAGRTVPAATFHDYCLQLLKDAGKDFSVLDEKDLWIYLRRRIKDLRLDYYIRAANVAQFLNDLLEFASRCHDELVTPEKYRQYVGRLERGELSLPRVAKSKECLEEEEILGRCREIARVFEATERWLQEENLGTFSHMITRAHELLSRDSEILAAARARARFILADEFQDANLAQIKILAQLAGKDGNIFAVGDPDQSIYRFRGASSEAFELFYRHFPSTRMVALEKNRRSTTPILRSAFELINENPPVFARQTNGRLAYQRTPLQSAREEAAMAAGTHLASAPVSVVTLTQKDSEGPELVALLRQWKRKTRCPWSDFAILYRSHVHRDDIVQELADADIPLVIDSIDIWDTPEVRDLLACVNAVVSSGDDVSLLRVAALAKFHVDAEQLRQALRANAKENRESKVVALSSELSRVEGGAEVLSAIASVREKIRTQNAKGHAALGLIVEEFSLDADSPILQAALDWVKDWERKKVNRSTDLEELVDYLGYFREAQGCILMNGNDTQDGVRLLTVHGAKGLEFRHVFIVRANSGSFPTPYKETLVAFPRELRDPESGSEADDKVLHAEEERRLFYVAMTRAMDSLRIYAREGTGTDKTPAGLMRNLIKNPKLAAWLRAMPASGSQTEIFGAASTTYPAESQTTRWFEMPPLAGLGSRLSASAIETYQRCGLQFKLDRDWRIPAKPAAAMQFGAAMHRVLKTYFDSLRAGRPKSDEELVELFCQDLADAGIQETYQRELYEKQGVMQLLEFLKLARGIPASQVLHTEEAFEIRIGETVVVGRIDRVDRRADGTVAIIDYKTGRARDQKAADDSLQLSLYAIAAHEKWKYDVGALMFQNLEENHAVVTSRTTAQLVKVRESVKETAEGIADGKFDAKPGNHCNFCAYRALCPEKEKRIPRRNEVGVGKN